MVVECVQMGACMRLCTGICMHIHVCGSMACLVPGYVARCLENFLFDQTFWLDPELLSDLEIHVSVDEEHLATLYLNLLVQEGERWSLHSSPPKFR